MAPGSEAGGGADAEAAAPLRDLQLRAAVKLLKGTHAAMSHLSQPECQAVSVKLAGLVPFTGKLLAEASALATVQEMHLSVWPPWNPALLTQQQREMPKRCCAGVADRGPGSRLRSGQLQLLAVLLDFQGPCQPLGSLWRAALHLLLNQGSTADQPEDQQALVASAQSLAGACLHPASSVQLPASKADRA